MVLVYQHSTLHWLHFLAKIWEVEFCAEVPSKETGEFVDTRIPTEWLVEDMTDFRRLMGEYNRHAI